MTINPLILILFITLNITTQVALADQTRSATKADFNKWLEDIQQIAYRNNPAFDRFLELEAPADQDPKIVGAEYLAQIRTAFQSDYQDFKTSHAAQEIRIAKQHERRENILQVPTNSAPWLCETGQIDIPLNKTENGVANCFEYISKMTTAQVQQVMNNNTVLLQRFTELVNDSDYQYSQPFTIESPNLPYESFRKAHKIYSINMLHTVLKELSNTLSENTSKNSPQSTINDYLKRSRALLSHDETLVNKGINFYVFSNALNLIGLIAQTSEILPNVQNAPFDQIPNLTPQEQSLCSAFKLEWGKYYYSMNKHQNQLEKSFPADAIVFTTLFNAELTATSNLPIFKQYCQRSEMPATNFKTDITEINKFKELVRKMWIPSHEQIDILKLNEIMSKINPSRGYIDTLKSDEIAALKTLTSHTPPLLSGIFFNDNMPDYAPNIERGYLINGKINLVNMLRMRALDPLLKNKPLTQEWINTQILSQNPINPSQNAKLNSKGNALCFDSIFPLVDSVKCIPIILPTKL